MPCLFHPVPRVIALTLAAGLLALAPATARADAALKAAEAQSPSVARKQVPPPAPQPEAISPRWIGPSWEITGLTVWVFKPGHFEGR